MSRAPSRCKSGSAELIFGGSSATVASFPNASSGTFGLQTGISCRRGFLLIFSDPPSLRRYQGTDVRALGQFSRARFLAPPRNATTGFPEPFAAILLTWSAEWAKTASETRSGGIVWIRIGARMHTPTLSSAVAIGSAFRRFSGRFNVLRWAFHNPLTADAPWSAINRFVRFRIASSVCGLSMVVPYVNGTKLIVSNDISAGCVNPIYLGLPDFKDMAFVLHLLTDDDLFGDVGANVGIYSVAASGVRGAKTVSMEPVPGTAEALRLNIAINGLAGLVNILEIGIGAEPGELQFTTGEGSCNHVVHDGGDCCVPVLPLDEVFGARTPLLLKIDVEGFETNVIKGAQRLLKDIALKAVLMELTGCGIRYGFDEQALDGEMRMFGFNSFSYDPWSRQLSRSDPNYQFNTIYVRDLVFVEHRLKVAKPFRVLQHWI